MDAESVMGFLANLPSDMRSSMQKDVEQGKLPELDAIAGPIVRAADRHRIEVPVTRRLVAAIEAMQNRV